MREIKIAPSMLSADFSKFGEEVVSVTSNGADILHLDVMDGSFVKNISFGPKFIKDARPFSSAVVAKVCRSPWNGICLHPARLSISESRFLQWQGLIGRLGSIGDGKIHSEFTRFRYSAKTFSTDSGKRTVLVEVLVLGVLMMNLDPIGVYSRRTLNSPVSKFRSSHCRPSSSPRRSPVASASRIIS